MDEDLGCEGDLVSREWGVRDSIVGGFGGGDGSEVYHVQVLSSDIKSFVGEGGGGYGSLNASFSCGIPEFDPLKFAEFLMGIVKGAEGFNAWNGDVGWEVTHLGAGCSKKEGADAASM